MREEKTSSMDRKLRAEAVDTGIHSDDEEGTDYWVKEHGHGESKVHSGHILLDVKRLAGNRLYESQAG